MLQKGEILQDNVYCQDYSNSSVQGVDNQRHVWNRPDYTEGQTSLMEVPAAETPGNWQPMSLPANISESNVTDTSYGMNNMGENQYQAQHQQQDQWPQHNNSQDYAPPYYDLQQQQPHYGNQVEPDGAQMQGSWTYEVSLIFIYWVWVFVVLVFAPIKIRI